MASRCPAPWLRRRDLGHDRDPGVADRVEGSLHVEAVDQLVDGAQPSLSTYGLPFVWHVTWNPVIGREVYGAGTEIECPSCGETIVIPAPVPAR